MATASCFTRYRSRQRFEQNCLCANRWRIRPNLPLHVSQRGVCFMGLRLVSLLVMGALPRQPGSMQKDYRQPESRAILRSRVGPQTCPSTLPVSVSASPDGIEAKPTDHALNLGTGQTGVRLAGHPLRCGFPRVLAPTRLLGPPPRDLIAPFRELRHHLKGMVGRSRNAQLGAFPHDVTVEKIDLAWFAAREILRGR